jgi:hypothetical protein
MLTLLSTWAGDRQQGDSRCSNSKPISTISMKSQTISHSHSSRDLFPIIGRLPLRTWFTLALPIGAALSLCLLSAQPLQAQPGPGPGNGDNAGGSGNAQGAIRNVRDQLVGMLDAAQTPTEAGLLNQAIKRLGRAIDPALWVDGGHLQPKLGQKVFGDVANAGSRMLTLMAQADSSASGPDMAALIDNLWRACGDLAGTAMLEAVDAGGDPVAIDDAVALFQQATDKIAAGDIQGGIQGDGAAWKRATEALP